MREIKFRAWDKFQEKFVFEGFHVIGEVTVFGGIEHMIKETQKERFKKYGYSGTIEAWDDFIITQYTGLKDKNGKDIYEGDIVRINNEDFDDCCIIDDITSIGWLKGFIDRERPVEVIGNKYENPELLN